MFGFFNKKDQLKAGLQAFNLLALGLASYDLLTNPQAKASDLGVDIAVHALSYFSLRSNSDVLVRFLGSGLNMFRSGAIYSALTGSAEATTPVVVSLVDMGLHFANAITPILSEYDDENEEAAKPKML